MIKGRTRLYQENLYFELQETPVNERPGISEWRNVLHSFGADPNEYPHLTERLMNQLSKENFIEPVHSATDLNTFFSLQYEIPIGIYDVTKLTGNIEFNVGTESTVLEDDLGQLITLNHYIYSTDDQGPFGSLIANSPRTAVSEGTTEIIQLFYLRPSLSENECNQLLQTAGKMFCQIHGGQFEVAQLNSNKNRIRI